MLQTITKTILRIRGWKVVEEEPRREKFLLLGAPHTTNWDFPLALLAMASIKLRFSWVAKESIFIGPARYLFRAIGGIPLNRSLRGGFLESMTRSFKEHNKLVIAVAPEGTRSCKDHWKGGFYSIAMKADIPVCLGYADYPSKTVGLGPYIKLTGNIEKDFECIRNFYQDKRGKYPAKESKIQLRPKEMKILQRELEAPEK